MNTLSLKTGIQTFSPAYFALAMSTGIISIASDMLGYHAISNVFFVINNIEFVILLIIFILRLLFFFPDFKRDLSSHAVDSRRGHLVALTQRCKAEACVT